MDSTDKKKTSTKLTTPISDDRKDPVQTQLASIEGTPENRLERSKAAANRKRTNKQKFRS
jgi:hypothetical protein